MSKSKSYQEDLIESLRDAREAEEYLNAALEEEDPELFLLALRNVTEAQGGVAQLAEKAKLNREWIQNNRARKNELKALYRFRLKLAALLHYGNGTIACSVCGYSADIDALCLDHINDDGAEHRKQLGCTGRGTRAGTTIYERVKALGWLPGLQVLCANCNTIKAVRKARGLTSEEMLRKVK